MEIRKDTIYFYTISLLTLGITFYTFLMVNEKQMRIKEDLTRTKTLRGKANAGKLGGNMDQNSIQKGIGKRMQIFHCAVWVGGREPRVGDAD